MTKLKKNMIAEEWRKANILTNGKRRKKHVPRKCAIHSDEQCDGTGCESSAERSYGKRRL